MNINLSRHTNILIKGGSDVEYEAELSKIGRSRGGLVRHFIEVDAEVIDEAILCYKKEELRAERAELMRKVKEIDKALGEDYWEEQI